MKIKYVILILFLLSNLFIKAQARLDYTPYFQLGGMYYSSEHITSAGAGPGVGISIGLGKHLLAKSDINMFWVNGNASSFRLALGYRRNGLWAPAGYLGISTIFGDRTELLFEDGSRPAIPVIAFGLQLSPLRFENEKGFVSVLEVGYGFGNFKGKNMEISVLSIGVKF